MSNLLFIDTPNLHLRRWRPDDAAPFAAINSEPEVMQWLARGPMSEAEAAGFLAQCEAHFEAHGFGIWAVERRSDGALIGANGLRWFHTAGHPMTPCVEIAWRQTKTAWGRGYATEAARAALQDGFQRLRLEQVRAWTAATNVRSQAVMQRIGMARAAQLDFDHPLLPPGHPLSRHVVYTARS